MKSNKFVFLVLTPIFLQLLIFLGIPIVGGLGISTFVYNPLRQDNHFIGLENFKRLLGDAVFLKSLSNTLTFVLVTVVLNICLTLLLAYFITCLRSGKARAFFRIVFFMPCVAPLVASSAVWRGLYSPKFGLINSVVKALGGAPQNWLGNPNTLMGAVILFTLWADMGYNVLIFSAGMDAIPQDFYEAAEIDGANGFSRFFRITLPLLGRTIGFVTSMTLISHFQMFAQFQVLAMNGGPEASGNVLTYYIYTTAFRVKDMGYASAIAVALFGIIMIVTIVQQRITRVDWGY